MMVTVCSLFHLLSVPKKGCASMLWRFLGSYLYFSFSSVALMPFPKTNQVSIVLLCNNASFLLILLVRSTDIFHNQIIYYSRVHAISM